ncbi:LysR family transcriptional regulator [Emcibacter nanhaiensis]|uniref:LysR family transcriptional regulator n=1 Tax=Emcibacter nanhaiensis TaxID=1505037 RepID=A0A501PGR4_9PROT|nr:LysR family transcriptional regulator [Emcibacter nanhaiensis]TPD59395.1 LysR family transcriptional regulator [Emcibacter nanhaiensis]
MDIAQIRTFIAVYETGSFLAAAERVNVTQSTVSIRIKNLENQIGSPLFERNKQGATPTAAGRQFLKHAVALSRIWDQARLEVGIGEEQETMVRLGAQVSLWDGFLLNLLPWMRAHAPEVAVRTETGNAPDLIRNLADNSLDIAVMYRPEQRPGFKVRQILDEELILVSSTEPGQDAFAQDYVYVNWGPEFQSDHALNFPDMEVPRVSLDVGTLGIGYLLNTPASGYFPKRTAAPLVRNGRLRIVEGAPHFTYPAYMVYGEALDETLVSLILAGLDDIRNALPELTGVSDSGKV